MQYIFETAMRTTFQAWEDKALVQIARQFELEGLQITQRLWMALCWWYCVSLAGFSLHTQPEAALVIEKIFEAVDREMFVNKLDGHKITQTIGPLHPSDVFLDVGAGIGNVLLQVALTTSVKTCVGFEMRAEKVVMIPTDVRDAALPCRVPTRDATTNLANMFLFEEDAKLIVARKLSTMHSARLIITTSPFCPRH
ncbi:histone H3-K79 methyltransferase [Phytophthora cactorum]|nr:histone H3-K79 methyltransferase [Phytophthora cactorum]